MKKINLKQLLVALGYGETTWKASRTRILKKINVENPSDTVMVTEEIARKVIEAVAEVKTKTLVANVMLGERKYLNFTEVYKEEVKATKPKATTSGNTTKKGLSQKEVENTLQIKDIVIRDLKKANAEAEKKNQKLEEKIKELEKLILEQEMKIIQAGL